MQSGCSSEIAGSAEGGDSPIVAYTLELPEGFPEIKDRADHVSTVVEAEEASFGRTLDRGLEIFRGAAELDNAFKADLAWTWLGRARNRLGRHEAALRALEKALEIFPRSPLALAERAYAHFELGDAVPPRGAFHGLVFSGWRI